MAQTGKGGSVTAERLALLALIFAMVAALLAGSIWMAWVAELLN